MNGELMPIMYAAFDSNQVQVQGAALVAVANLHEHLDEVSVRQRVLPKLKMMYENNNKDVKVVANVLRCIERIIDKMDQKQVQICKPNINQISFLCCVYLSTDQ